MRYLKHRHGRGQLFACLDKEFATCSMSSQPHDRFQSWPEDAKPLHHSTEQFLVHCTESLPLILSPDQYPNASVLQHTTPPSHHTTHSPAQRTRLRTASLHILDSSEHVPNRDYEDGRSHHQKWINNLALRCFHQTATITFAWPMLSSTCPQLQTHASNATCGTV